MPEASGDPAVERMKQARDTVAVLKLRLITFKGNCPDIPILIMEGNDDKLVYSQWIRRVRPTLEYEHFVCHGKRQVLSLKGAIDRDMGNLGSRVYFFVDRDFDDLVGTEPSDRIFMIDCYSTENYLVNQVVLDDILKVELHCNGNPVLRQKMLTLFNKVYDEFLQVTRPFNERLFISKKASIARKGAFPERVNQLAVIHIDKVQAQVREPKEVIGLEREPTDEEISSWAGEFDKLDPRDRYRGKFALLFFQRWLDLIVEDYSSVETNFFSEIEGRARARHNEIVYGTLASRSPMPAGITEFIQSI